MKISLLNCYGLDEALYGLGKSYGVTSDMSFGQFKARINVWERMYVTALKLAPKDGGHNKFLEHIITYWDIQATRKWWSHMDTYRVGMSKQSESTMHTIAKRLLTPADCSPHVLQEQIDIVNRLITEKADVEIIKDNLPDGFLQTREVMVSLNKLIAIYNQRKNHKLPEWQEFCFSTFESLPGKVQAFVVSYPQLKEFFNG
jgi:hypothetical protein